MNYKEQVTKIKKLDQSLKQIKEQIRNARQELASQMIQDLNIEVPRQFTYRMLDGATVWELTAASLAELEFERNSNSIRREIAKYLFESYSSMRFMPSTQEIKDMIAKDEAMDFKIKLLLAEDNE